MEAWKEIYTEEQIKKIQEIELKNLRVLDEVCKKLGIEFFLYGGSLIGAVRHKGFVPWDDDLDVAMSRKDYMRFVNEAPNLLPENYCLQTPYNDKKSPYSYTKLRLNGTKYVEYINRKKKSQGIYVDIYPIDNLPDSDEEYYKSYKKHSKYSKLLSWRQSPYLEEKSHSLKVFVKRFVKFTISAFLKIVPQPCFIKKLDKIATQYNSIDTAKKGNFHYPKPVNYFKNLYPLQDGVFEGYSVKLPGDWHQHLTSRYGNYMQFPPEEERIGHKPYILDFGEY